MTVVDAVGSLGVLPATGIPIRHTYAVLVRSSTPPATAYTLMSFAA